MRFFQKTPDGGANSGTTAYFLIEIKSLFSIALLRFDNGSPKRLHTHAFNAYTLWLKGKVTEHHRDGKIRLFSPGMFKTTKRNTFHKIEAYETAWALTFRGPWVRNWLEDRNGTIHILGPGRVEEGIIDYSDEVTDEQRERIKKAYAHINMDKLKSKTGPAW